MPARTAQRTNARNRSVMDPSVPGKRTPAIIASIATTASDTIQIIFNTRVIKNKTPGFTAGAGGAVAVKSAAQISDTVVELTFNGEVQSTDLIVGQDDPGVRTPSGGFVPAGTYAIPAFP